MTKRARVETTTISDVDTLIPEAADEITDASATFTPVSVESICATTCTTTSVTTPTATICVPSVPGTSSSFLTPSSQLGSGCLGNCIHKKRFRNLKRTNVRLKRTVAALKQNIRELKSVSVHKYEIYI